MVKFQQIEDSRPVVVDVPAVLSAQQKMAKCRTVVLIKIEMDVYEIESFPYGFQNVQNLRHRI